MRFKVLLVLSASLLGINSSARAQHVAPTERSMSDVLRIAAASRWLIQVRLLNGNVLEGQPEFVTDSTLQMDGVVLEQYRIEELYRQTRTNQGVLIGAVAGGAFGLLAAGALQVEGCDRGGVCTGGNRELFIGGSVGAVIGAVIGGLVTRSKERWERLWP